MEKSLLVFLLGAAVIVMIAALWPAKQTDDAESRDWRIQDFKKDGDLQDDEDLFPPQR